jgi:pimeloyl-ACP methyl ester carboxylesterase
MPLLLAFSLISAAPAADPQAHTVYLPADAAGQHLALHCVEPAKATHRAALFVHGASFPTGLAAGFEFAPGDSWLAFMARRGYLACGLDFLGFGDSSRPPALEGEAGAAPPVTRAPEAAREIARAVDYLRTERGITAVHLVAHSWGTIPAADYAAGHPHALSSLTLFGPVVPARDAGAPTTDAWWGITAQQRYRQLLFSQVLPAGVVLLEPAVTRHWAAAFAASVPHVPGDAPGLLRIPAGPAADIGAAEHGVYPYDPAKVAAPVLVVYGDHDTVVDDARASTFLAGFTASPLKWRLRIDHGTHVMHLERNRRSLYWSVDAFINAAEAAQP